MYHFNERSLIQSRINTINLFLKKFKLFSRPIALCCCSTLNFYFEVNFWLRMMYIVILKISNVRKTYIFQENYQFFSESKKIAKKNYSS